MPGANRSLNLDELMAAIRNELGERPAAVASAVAANVRDRMQASLATAARYAPLSSLVPEFAGWSPLKRRVAVPLSKVVMYLARFITNKQTLFNEAILQSVRELVELTASNAASAENLEALRVQVRRLAAEVRSARVNAPSAPAVEPSAPEGSSAVVALAARMESLTVRLAALEEHVARLSAPAPAEAPPEGVASLGRRAHSES